MTDIRHHEVGTAVYFVPDENLVLLRDSTPVAVWTNGVDYATHKIGGDWHMCYGKWRYRKIGNRAERVA